MTEKRTKGEKGPSGKKPRLPEILGLAEKFVYYGVAIALLITVGMLFVSAGASVLTAVFISTGPRPRSRNGRTSRPRRRG